MGCLKTLCRVGFGLFAIYLVSPYAGNSRTTAVLYVHGSAVEETGKTVSVGEEAAAGKDHPVSGSEPRKKEEEKEEGLEKGETATPVRSAKGGLKLRRGEKPKPHKKFDFEKYEEDRQLFQEMRQKAKNYAEGADVVEAQAQPPTKPGFLHILWERFLKFLDSRKRTDLAADEDE